MKKIKIITDSNSGITQEEGKNLGVFVIPMPFTIDGEEYLEEITISQEQFFEKLESGAEVKTSQPSEIYQEELWTELLKENDQLIYIPMTSGLSSTCENAKRYAKNFDGKVFVVDNQRISAPQKISVYEAAYMAKDGKTAEEIVEYLETNKSKHSIYLTVNVLKYLRKGGRITAAVAVLGDLLKLKPILSSRGQVFDKYGLALSMSQAKKKMMQKIRSELETEFLEEYEQGQIALLVAYTKCKDDALKFKQEIEKEFPDLKVLYADPLSLSIACHTGPGALGIALCKCNYLK